MHIHIQNRLHNAFLPITRVAVDGTSIVKDHRVTIGDTDADFAEAIRTAEVVVTTLDQLKARFPCAAPGLKAVFLAHAGVDGLDGHNPLPEGIMLLNNSGAHARKAGEFVLMATLMLAGNMHRLIAQQHQRQWRPLFSPSIAGRRITIIGVGGLGSGAARALRPLGVHLTGIRNGDQPHPDFDLTLSIHHLDHVLEATDTLVLAAPLTPATRQMIGLDQLARLPNHAHLINIGRGELLDQRALIDALHVGQIDGAVLDVQQVEPLPPEDRLWSTPNLIITPHVSSTDAAGYAAETLRVLGDNLAAMTLGLTPPNLVDVARGY